MQNVARLMVSSHPGQEVVEVGPLSHRPSDSALPRHVEKLVSLLHEL